MKVGLLFIIIGAALLVEMIRQIALIIGVIPLITGVSSAIFLYLGARKIIEKQSNNTRKD